MRIHECNNYNIWDIRTYNVLNDGTLDFDLARRVVATKIDSEWAIEIHKAHIQVGMTLWVVRDHNFVEKVTVVDTSVRGFYGQRAMLGKNYKGEEETEKDRVWFYSYHYRIIDPGFCLMYEMYEPEKAFSTSSY